MALDTNGLRCQSRNKDKWHGVRASKGVSGRGRYYYEALVEDEGLCRVGFSTQEVRFQICTEMINADEIIFSNRQAWSWALARGGLDSEAPEKSQTTNSLAILANHSAREIALGVTLISIIER